MANSNTEHSKQLRAKTAAEWRKRQFEEGKLKRLGMELPAEVMDDFDALAQALGLSRPKTLKLLLDHYHQSR